jgi:predicted RNase H-like nuclease
MTRVLGVDGCRGGWFGVFIDANLAWELRLETTPGRLLDERPAASQVLVDMPVGLAAGSPRACDTEARRLLAPWRNASVFPVPCRAAVRADTYVQACRINQECLNRKLTRQTWNICDKIRQLDELLLSRPEWRQRLHESHPEVCFVGLHGGPMRHAKRSSEGLEERLALLERYYSRSRALYHAALDAWPRKQLARDDVVDALVLAVTAMQPAECRRRLPRVPQVDELGLPMEIVYADCGPGFRGDDFAA